MIEESDRLTAGSLSRKRRGHPGCLHALVVLTLAAALGCGAEDRPGDERETTVLGNFGALEFTATPLAPPVAGRNAFHLGLYRHSSQAPLDGASLKVHAMMPSMGHEATAEPHIDEIEPGLYAVTNVVFSMAGTWEVRYRAERASLHDEAAFRYQVR
jgi:hypothetical protein